MVKSVHSPSANKSVTAAIVPTVTCDLPLQGATGMKDLDRLKDIPLADPDFDKPGKIDLLIGCDILLTIILNKYTRNGEPTMPSVTKTIFGRVVWRPYNPQMAKTSPSAATICHISTAPSSDDQLRRFWEVEETPLKATFTPEVNLILIMLSLPQAAIKSHSLRRQA